MSVDATNKIIGQALRDRAWILQRISEVASFTPVAISAVDPVSLDAI